MAERGRTWSDCIAELVRKTVVQMMAMRAVDLASQAVISFTEYKIKQRSDMYPVGRARLEVSRRR